MEDQENQQLNTSSLLNKEFGSVLEKRRWFILAAFSIFSASNAMLWITYSPIITYVQDYYGIEAKEVLEFSDSYMYIYFALSFLGSWLSYKWFTVSLIGAMIINTFGAWLRYFAGHSYAIALTGQYFAALAQNVVLFVPVLIADRWFAARERNWVVSIAISCNLLGWGFGFMFPTLLVQDGAGRITELLQIEAIISTLPLIIGIFCIRERPRVPPSYSALVKQNDHGSYWQELKSILINWKFVLVIICFGNIIGQSYTLSSVIVLFLPNSSLIEQGLVGVFFITCGILGSLFGTMYLSKSKSDNYDLVVRIFMIMSMIGLVALALVIKTENMTLIYALNGILGVGLLGFQPFGCQTLVEMTFPVQEAISVNLMMVMAQLFGLIGNALSTAKFVQDKGLWSLSAIVAPCVFYIVFFHKTDAKRKHAEEQHQKMDKEAITSMIEGSDIGHDENKGFLH